MVFFPKVSLSLSRRSFIAFVVLRRKTFPRRKTFSCPPISALSECVKITDFMFISSNTRVRVKAKRESSASSVFGTRSTEIIVRSVLNTRVFFNSLTLCVLRCEQTLSETKHFALPARTMSMKVFKTVKTRASDNFRRQTTRIKMRADLKH